MVAHVGSLGPFPSAWIEDLQQDKEDHSPAMKYPAQLLSVLIVSGSVR